jgi:hypothetical protein
MTRRFLGNKRALGAPVGNIIILVAAVTLSTTVVFFATNVASSQVQKESLFIPSSHVWYVNSTNSVAALAVTNTGPVDIVLTKLDIKGLQCQWNGTDNFVIYTKTNSTLPGDLPYVADIPNGNITIKIGGTDYDFTTAETGLTLRSGYTMAFYVAVPNRVMVYDLSTPLRMVISTTQAVYCTETLVQTA